MDTKVESQAKEAGRHMSEAGQEVKEATATLAERARERAQRMGEAWESTRANLQERGMATDRAIRDNPYASLGIAFGIGLLIGVLVNRSRE
jgi:ElaB/YqjD/DUF883 family membrane-anchored ribosome-binding protein